MIGVAEQVLPSVSGDRADVLASHLDFLWRFACRMGVGSAAAEDIAQEAFVIALSRIDTLLLGKERSFLVSIVVNMVRRERQRRNRYEELTVEPVAPQGDAPDRVLDDKRARELLDRSLDALDDDLRAVFVLHEIEQETMADIAQLLDLAPGTVALAAAPGARGVEARNGAPQARSHRRTEVIVSEDYDDFDRALLRAGKRAKAPSNLRARAAWAATAAGVTTKAAAATKVAGLAKAAKLGAAALRVATLKWTLVAAVTTASVGAAVYVREAERVAAVPAVSAPATTTPAATPRDEAAPAKPATKPRQQKRTKTPKTASRSSRAWRRRSGRASS